MNKNQNKILNFDTNMTSFKKFSLSEAPFFYYLHKYQIALENCFYIIICKYFLSKLLETLQSNKFADANIYMILYRNAKKGICWDDIQSDIHQ